MVQMYDVAQRDTVQLQSWKPVWQPCFWSHDLRFLHKPIVYGVAHLLYGVVLSDSVIQLCALSHPVYILYYGQIFAGSKIGGLPNRLKSVPTLHYMYIFMCNWIDWTMISTHFIVGMGTCTCNVPILIPHERMEIHRSWSVKAIRWHPLPFRPCLYWWKLCLFAMSFCISDWLNVHQCLSRNLWEFFCWNWMQ